MRKAALTALLAATVLALVAGPASAARIVLEIGDGPNQGFNSPTPVSPVAGNPGRTLGEQRVNVFEAAAAVWEHRLVSHAVIRVSASYDSDELECSGITGTLAAAAPTLAFRSVPGQVRPATWYTWAQANAMAGRELEPNEKQAHIEVTVNPDVGTPGCLNSLRWDHRIGTAVLGTNVSLFGVLMHEIGHGLGVLELVDHE
ncbi:MAG: hypothetical protein R3190_10270, partial [Thermoanaerobaculia bacterium]|nr:hypothetical protein [Thermoanaerobaculia bacterium]